MIVNGRAIISEDIKESNFVCDLNKCKGACCVEGDLGAPLEEEELSILKKVFKKVLPYLSEEGRRAIKDQGPFVFDEDKEYSTPTINGKECAYAIYDKQGVLKCGIEKAYSDGKINFQKPISCHLYPIRIKKYDEFDALNYDRWHICNPACKLGDALKVPVYTFVKEALVRKYGKDWYDQLIKIIENSEKDKQTEDN